MFLEERKMCDGVLIVHLDRTTTCTNTDCVAPALIRCIVDLHSTFVPCRAIDSQGCPRCDEGA